MSLTRKALNAIKWSMLAELASRAVGPFIFLIMARLLVPEDFGVVAAASVIISFSQVFSDAGLSKALIQRQDRIEESANIVFWLNLGIGTAIVSVLLVGAPMIARFFHDERIGPVTRVLSLQILLAAFSSVHTALLQKNLNFKPLFWVRLTTTAIPALASIPLAVYGMGYWALVAGALLGQVAQSVSIWIFNPWRPQWRLDPDLTRELITFGKWAMLSGLLSWFYVWLDAIVVGHYLGPREMGLYRTANTFITMIFGLIFSPLLPVLYSLFSRARLEPQKLGEALQTVSHAIALVALPLGFGLFALGDRVGAIFFGADWNGVGLVVGFMALVHAFSWIVGANGEVYRSIGKPHIETWVNASMLLIYLAGYLFSVQFGLQRFVEARLGLALLAMVAHICIARMVLGVPILKWLYPAILITSVTAAAIVDQLRLPYGLQMIEFLLTAFLFTAISLAGIALFDRHFLRRLAKMAQPQGH